MRFLLENPLKLKVMENAGRVLRRSRRTATSKTSPITPPCLINATATATTNIPIAFQDLANLPSTMSLKDLEALKLVINKCGFGRLDGDKNAKDKLEALIYELKRCSYELEQVTRVQEPKDRQNFYWTCPFPKNSEYTGKSSISASMANVRSDQRNNIFALCGPEGCG